MQKKHLKHNTCARNAINDYPMKSPQVHSNNERVVSKNI